jgi:hypothetical protein
MQQQQIIKVYRGANMDRQFQHEAARLAQQGYIVQSQSYGGQKGVGVGKAVAFGAFSLLGSRKPKEMTVIYVRQVDNITAVPVSPIAPLTNAERIAASQQRTAESMQQIRESTEQMRSFFISVFGPAWRELKTTFAFWRQFFADRQKPSTPSTLDVPPVAKSVPTRVWIVTGVSALIIFCCLGSLIAQGHGSNTSANAATNNNSNSTSNVAKTPKPSATPTHTPRWSTVQTFTGNGSKKTDTFHIDDTWKINWSCTPSSFDSGSYNLIVSVDNKDGTSLDFGAINTMCKDGNTQDSTNEHTGGDVYLDIISEGDWTFQVQEYK